MFTLSVVLTSGLTVAATGQAWGPSFYLRGNIENWAASPRQILRRPERVKMNGSDIVSVLREY